MPTARTNLPPALSIVIPVLNEADKIRADIMAAAEYCHGRGLRAEIVISDDGSEDDSVEVARQSQVGLPDSVTLIVLEGDGHHGKGWAVRRGLLAAEGTVIMFADSGGNVAWDFISGALDLLSSGNSQIVHGSRKLPQSNILVRQPTARRIISRLFQGLAQLMLPIPAQLTDTQCGFKFYNRDIAKTLYSESSLDGFLFDLEIILRAQIRGLAILEYPLDWRCDRDSRLHLRSNFYQMGKELLFLYRTFGGKRGRRLNGDK